MAGAGREIQEERLVRVGRAQVAEKFHGPAGQVLGEVVAVRSWRPDGMIVVIESRHELMGLAAMEAIPAVEAAAERPGGARGGHARLVLGRQVPFADRVGGIARRPQDFRQVAVLARRTAPVAGVADGQVRDSAHAAAVMVAPGQQADAGRGAERGRVEVGQPGTGGRQPVEHRRPDVRAVTAQLGEADVIEHHQDDIGRTRWRRRHWRPPRRRVAPVPADAAAELLCHSRLLSSGAACRAAEDSACHRKSAADGTR
jgi:hypothetical protein